MFLGFFGVQRGLINCNILEGQKSGRVGFNGRRPKKAAATKQQKGAAKQQKQQSRQQQRDPKVGGPRSKEDCLCSLWRLVEFRWCFVWTLSEVKGSE